MTAKSPLPESFYMELRGTKRGTILEVEDINNDRLDQFHKTLKAEGWEPMEGSQPLLFSGTAQRFFKRARVPFMELHRIQNLLRNFAV